MRKPAKLTAAATAAGLSLLFLAVYGACNWITSRRGDVGTWYYAWELRLIPFVPLMIVPYMSIDLLFVAGPFLCANREELRTLARRLSLAILVAGACFLLLPLKMGVPRPACTGWTGALFRLLHGFDQPYNLVPSLHIALRTILADLYARHTKGFVRAASNTWFSLVGFSTVLTYQHHVVDVIGGFILALFCFYLNQDDNRRLPVIPNCRVGGYYFAGAAACVALAWIGWPWSGVLLWPALALGIAAAGYFGLGPVIYRKHNGRLPFSARLLLAPVLLGQHLSLLHYRRQCDAWNEVTPRVWIGARLNPRAARAARRRGVTAVLDLTAEFSETQPFLDAAYLNLPVLDLTGLNFAQMREASDFISRHSRDGVVYVHCKVGYSRSAAAVAAWLLGSGQAGSVDESLALLRRVRPTIVVRPEAVASLEHFAASLAYLTTGAAADVRRRTRP